MRNSFSVIKQFIRETDKVLLLLCAAASAFGSLMVYSATLPDVAEGKFISRDALVMVLAVFLGIAVALFISTIDFEWIMKLWPAVGLFCIGILIVTMIWGVAPDARTDARSWLKLGPVFFQPSELVKIGFIITFAMHLELAKDSLNKITTIAMLGVHAIIPTVLVMRSDMGSALVFVIVAVGMMFVAGVHWGYFAVGGVLCALSVPLLWTYVLKQFQKDRLLAIIKPELYPEEIYQQENGLNAIGNGGFFGSGLFKGAYTQSGVVPESENDMIFSVVGEETGFVGAMLALIILSLIIMRIINTSRRSQDNPSRLMCCGVAIMIGSQIIINLGMCLMLLPVIGITLPFFSAGGSSIICIYIGIGLIMSIYRSSCERSAINFRMSNISTPFRDAN
ncbi:MAG: FtsW/RodA/SpoVE family cell cycle protein [Clostridiales bacterium]|nr:FtsW/RodA/SpoVE family cell cycle protein [Clostridiales bacterium]